MAADGFRVADGVGFTANDEYFGAEAFRFASASAAADFQRATLQRLCAAGAMVNTRALTGLTEGVSFILPPVPGSPPFRAAFVAGDTVVHLNICECVEAPDDQVLIGQWAHTVAAAVGAQ